MAYSILSSHPVYIVLVKSQNDSSQYNLNYTVRLLLEREERGREEREEGEEEV